MDHLCTNLFLRISFFSLTLRRVRDEPDAAAENDPSSVVNPFETESEGDVHVKDEETPRGRGMCALLEVLISFLLGSRGRNLSQKARAVASSRPASRSSFSAFCIK